MIPESAKLDHNFEISHSAPYHKIYVCEKCDLNLCCWDDNSFSENYPAEKQFFYEKYPHGYYYFTQETYPWLYRVIFQLPITCEEMMIRDVIL